MTDFAFGLDDLIHPLSTSEFLGRYWSKEFLFLRGGVRNPERLFSWDKLNAVLTTQRLTYPRVRIMSGGEPLRQELFTIRRQTMRNANHVEQLDLAMVNFHLSKGANLIVNGLDEMDLVLRNGCQALGQAFQNHASVNAYAAFGATRGFARHWDDHETFIVQIDGRKRWVVFGQARLHPLSDDVEGNTTPPEEPIWDGVLEPGDILNIPRGFWHEVTPVGERTLHLTFSVEPATGLHWLKWAMDSVASSPLARMNIPIFDASSSMEQYERELRDVAFQYLSRSNLKDYVESRNGRLNPLPGFSLPEAIDGGMEDTLVVRFAGIAHAVLAEGRVPGTFAVSAFDRDWNMQTVVKPMVDSLLTGEPRSIAELLALAPGSSMSIDQGRAFLKHLLMEGFIEKAT